MKRSWLPAVVVGAALLAAWGGARYAGATTLLLATALVTALALEPAERRLIPSAWAAVMLLLLSVSWLVALDHELALRHTLTVVLAVSYYALARRAGTGDAGTTMLALGLAATAIAALPQVLANGPPPASALSSIAPELRDRVLERLAVGRASGTAAIPGHFGVLLVIAAPLLAARLGRQEKPWLRALSFGGLLLIAGGIVASRSLIAVAIAATLVAAALALRRDRAKVYVAGGALLLVVAVATAALRSDLATLEPVRMRWVNWTTAAWVITHHAPLGVGLGGVAQAGLTGPAGAANITPYAHCTPLQLGAELGVAGFGLVVVGLVALWRLLAAGAREHLSLTLAVAVLPLHNLVDFSAYAPEIVVPWAVLAGTLAARVTPLPDRPLPRWPLIGVLGGGLVIAAASWRSESLLTSSYTAPPPRAVELAMAAARWAPWTASPMVSAAGTAIGSGDARLPEIDREFAARWWVRPVSSGWAETRARLLLAMDRRGEALSWSREAQRRAPWRRDLAPLLAACEGPP